MQPSYQTFSRSNTRERVALAGIYRDVGVPCIYSDLMMRLSLNEKIGSRFMELLLRHSPVRRQLTGNAQGTSGSMVKISSQTVMETVVLLPLRKEQDRIISVMDTLDQAIAQTSSLIAKLKLMKAGLLHDLLTRGLDENGELRDVIGHPEQFKDSPLGRIPKDWKCLTINDCLRDGLIVDVQDGNHGEAHPKTDDFVSEGIPFVMAKDLVNGQINLAECHKITWHQYQSLRIGFARPGDVLLSHKGTIGLIAMVPSSLQHIMLTPQVTYYRVPKEKHLLGRFLFWFFHAPLFQQRLEVLSAQSTRSYIGITLQKTLSILIPPPDEQSRIVEIFDTHNTRIRAEEAYRNKLKLQKQGLMHDLLTGKIRLQ